MPPLHRLASCCAVLGLAALPAGAGSGGAFHPQDGPDVDLRIRIDDEAVRCNLILNLAFVDEIVETGREDDYSLHPVEHEGVHLALFDYFHEELSVSIDGVAVQPVDAGFEVAEADMSLLPLFPGFGTKALIKVRLALDYPVKTPPERVTVVWPAYPPDYVQASEQGTPPLEVIAQLFAGGVDTLVTFRESEPEYTWHATAETYADRFLAVPEPAPQGGPAIPALSIGLVVLFAALGGYCFLAPSGRRLRRVWLVSAPFLLAAAATTTEVGRVELPGTRRLPSEEEALAIFRPLHANIYRAFDYTEESDVYDALAQSVHGDLLDRLYNEIYRSLVMQEEGGAVARVQAVTPLETDVESVGLIPPEEAPGFTVVARWQVEGAVHHWGHSHYRTNEYQARYGVLASDAGWRIADSQVLEQRRVDATPIAPPEDL